jgi:hypothetical protein
MNMELQSPDHVANDAVLKGMQECSLAVVVALTHIEQTAGAEVSAAMAEIMVRLAVHHLLDRIGPQAAKAALVRVYADLETEIEAANSGSALLS